MSVCGLAAISIHAAREGGDTQCSLNASPLTIFQSTPPVKAATCFDGKAVFYYDISIHAAREGGDADTLIQRFGT